MNKSHIIIGAISIAVMIIVGVILFIYPDLIGVNNYNIITPTYNFVKNLCITIFCGLSIYVIFYGIPHEYKVVNKKNNTDQK